MLAILLTLNYSLTGHCVSAGLLIERERADSEDACMQLVEDGHGRAALQIEIEHLRRKLQQTEEQVSLAL